MVYTLRVKFQDNQGIVQFRNGSNETTQLRKDKAVGILDFRSIGYFKVGYQKMVNMAESSKTFKMYHYKQIKCEAKTENWSTSDQYMRITGRYGNEKSRKTQESEKQSELGRKSDPYPWLTEDDPRRHQTDEEILYEKIDLSNSALSRKEKTRLMKVLIKYRDAFSLRDEIGDCPNLKADIKVIDDSPFFVRPFPISENDQPFMDDQMERLVSLGILSKNSTSHTSPVMLITRKSTKDKRPVVDFRLLNTRILRRNTSIPLMSDVLSMCHASARLPAFLPTMPHIPSSLEGRWSRKAPSRYCLLNRANGLGRNPDSSHGLWPQPIRGLPAIEPRTF